MTFEFVAICWTEVVDIVSAALFRTKLPGMTTSPEFVADKFKVPWLTIVPPVKVLGAVSDKVPAPDLTRRVFAEPLPLSLMMASIVVVF